jgi:hypothetical protein
MRNRLAKFKQTVVTTAALLILILATPIRAGDISPTKWPAAERELAEKREAAGWASTAARSILMKRIALSW